MMYNLTSTITIEGVKVKIFKPDTCPFCEKGIDPIIINKFVADGMSGCTLFVAMKCPICGQVFVCKYLLGLTLSDASYSRMCFPCNGILGGSATKQSFSEEINELSPDFVKIYNQAYEAEQIGLDEIYGMGYRKAFEFLIKDFAISEKPEEKDKLIKMKLSQCINYVFSEKERNIIEKTSWIGNDQTHYEKKHNQFSVSDLKKMILICVAKIETAIREKKYLEEFDGKDGQ